MAGEKSKLPPGLYSANIADTIPEIKKLPGNVQRINIDNEKATVELKDGTQKEYDLSNETQKKDFEDKYGELPPPPPIPGVPSMAPTLAPTPPPMPPAVPKGANMVTPPPPPAIAPEPPVPPTPPAAPDTEHMPVCAVKQNCKLSKETTEYEITATKATLKMKNGNTEVYDLTNKTEKQNFESKYGKLYPSTDKAPRALTPAVYRNDDYSYRITGKEDILITITKNTTKEQLEDFKRQMKEKEIELTYDNIDYNNGILVSISGTMRSKDGHSNFVASDFNKLCLAMIKKGDRTYFKVSVRDDKVSI
jgi:hypothetical protein